MDSRQTVLVTGGNRGIGLAAADRFRQAGFAVIALGRDFTDFPLAGEANVRTVRYDLRDIEGIPRLIKELGEINILVNNAGIMHALPYDDYPAEKVEEIINGTCVDINNGAFPR